MHQTISLVLSRRLVTIVGGAGVGKTAVVSACCLYLAERRLFEDGVMYLRLYNVTSYERILKLLERELGKDPYRSALNKSKSMNTDGNDDVDIDRLSIGGGGAKLPSKEDLLNSTPSPSSSTSTFVPSMFVDTSFDSQKSGGFSGNRKEDEIYAQEENIIQSLSQARMLIVFDHIQGILSAEDKTVTDFKMFLSRLLDRCKQVKILVSSTESLDMRSIVGNVVIENCLTLGPLTLRSSLRLFTRLSPCFPTSQSKTQFINQLTPPRQSDVTIQSRDLSPIAAQILFLFGNGHPAKIVKLAGDSDEEAVNGLLRYGLMRMQAKSNSAKLNADADGDISAILGRQDEDRAINDDAPPVIDKKGSLELLLGEDKA